MAPQHSVESKARRGRGHHGSATAAGNLPRQEADHSGVELGGNAEAAAGHQPWQVAAHSGVEFAGNAAARARESQG